LFSLCFSFLAEGVSSYWFCGFLAARGVSDKAFLAVLYSMVFSLVLNLCVLAQIHATRASMLWSPASFGLIVTSRGRAVLPCLVRDQHVPESFLPGPAREGHDPLFRS
jgi:uncharacterized membrane protein YagU involved in acid resistance